MVYFTAIHNTHVQKLFKLYIVQLYTQQWYIIKIYASNIIKLYTWYIIKLNTVVYYKAEHGGLL